MGIELINTMTRNHLAILQQKQYYGYFFSFCHLSLSYSLIIYFDWWMVDTQRAQQTVTLSHRETDRLTILINSTISKVKFILPWKSFKISTRWTTFVIFFVLAFVKRCMKCICGRNAMLCQQYLMAVGIGGLIDKMPRNSFLNILRASITFNYAHNSYILSASGAKCGVL